MRKIGVILCSKSKQDYPCSVREMYCSSVLFRAREYFMDLAYDEWYVNTSKYGFMKPDMKIEPYNGWYLKKMSKNGQLKNNNNVLTQEMVDTWLDRVSKQFPNPEEIELHAHMSQVYVKELSKIFPNIVYIKPEISFTSTAWKYVDACKMLLQGNTLNECLKFLNTKKLRTRPKEQIKGKAWDLSKKYNIDNGSCYGLSMGSYNMVHGWVTDKKLLDKIKYYPTSNIYRLQKGYSKVNRQGQRMNIHEAFDELEFDIDYATSREH